MTNDRENVVPLFQSYDQMVAEHRAALEEYADITEPLFKTYDARLAVIDGDDQTLAKCVDGDVDAAKAFVIQHGASAKVQAAYECAVVLVPAVKRRNARLYGVSELAKRSQRFAAVVARTYHGPSSEVTPLEGRRR